MGFIHVKNVFQKEVITFSRLWEEHTQDEAQPIIREENMGATKDQALTVHTRKNYKKKEKKEKKENHHHNKKDKKQKKVKRDPSNVRCYTYDENGHFARDCPIRKKRHHAHVSKENEPKKNIQKTEG